MISKEALILLASNPNFYNIIEKMLENNELKSLLPDIYLMKFYEQSEKWHPEGNVLQHTIQSLKVLKSDDYRVNLAILFHDIGKALAYKLRDGKHTYYNHERLGAVYFKEYISKCFNFDDMDRDIILYCIKNHMRYHQIPNMKNRKVKALINHDFHQYLHKVSFADTFSRGDDIAVDMWKKVIDKIHLVNDTEEIE